MPVRVACPTASRRVACATRGAALAAFIAPTVPDAGARGAQAPAARAATGGRLPRRCEEEALVAQLDAAVLRALEKNYDFLVRNLAFEHKIAKALAF